MTASIAMFWRPVALMSLVLALVSLGAGPPAATAPATRPTTAPTVPEPAVEGDERYRAQIESALALLREKSPEDHAFVCQQVRLVRQGPRSGTHVEEGRCIIDLSDVTVGGSVAWTASVLVHESNHNRQYRDDLANHGHPVAAESYTGVEAELACNQVQLRALERVGGTPREIVYLKSQDGKHFDVDGDGDYDWDDYRLRRW